MTLNCKGTLLNLDAPVVMGILNLTPDSFYDGGKYKNRLEVLKQTDKMLKDGASIIDIGGYSSRPGAEDISEERELNRVIPIVEDLVETFPDIIISADTFRSEVARQSIKAGAAIINDISAGHLDSKMMETVGELQVPYIMMHMRGTPQTMKDKTDYNNLVEEILFYFSERIACAKKHGINDLILDPGFGFAKTTDQSFSLLNQLELLSNLKLPVLAGMSRKSMITKTLDLKPKEALNGTSVLNTIALHKKASILRVHDVKEAKQVIQLIEKLRN